MTGDWHTVHVADTTAIADEPASTTAEPGRKPRVPRWAVVVLALLVAAWAVPALLHALGADWALLPLIWLATASLLRAGRTVLDRLVLAALLLYAGACVVWLGLSYAPWGMQPTPVAGLTFTALIAVGVALRRVPRLPRAVRVADLGIAAASALTAWFAFWPLRGMGWRGHLGMFLTNDDFARHFTMYDTIRVVRGYLFTHPKAAGPHLDFHNLLMPYPQGSHLVSAIVTAFLTGSDAAGSGRASMQWYIVMNALGWVLFVTVALWAARWVGGPALSRWAGLVTTAGLTVLLLYGYIAVPYTWGYPSEIGGMTMLAALVALLIRPVARTREQLVLVALLTTGVSFTYYLYLPFAALLILVWLGYHRRRLLRIWPTTLVVLALGAAATAVIPVLNLGGASSGDRLLLSGGSPTVGRAFIIGFGALVLAGAAARAGRSIAWRTATWAIVIGAVLTLVLLWYQFATIGHTIYYFEKTLRGLLVVLIVTAGGLAATVLGQARHGARGRLGRVAVPALAGVALLVPTVPSMNPGHDEYSPGRNYASRKVYQFTGRAAHLIDQAITRWPTGDGYMTVVATDGPWTQFWGTLYVNALQRNYRAGQYAAYNWEMPQYPERRHLFRDLPNSPLPVRFVTDTASIAAAARRLAAAHPELRMEIVQLSA